MNRPEPIELENNLGPDAVTGEINRVPWMAYDVDEMDLYIAELEQKLAEKDKEIAELKEDRRWHKCSEELPKDGAEVLATDGDGIWLCYKTTMCDGSPWFQPDGLPHIDGVTHWMPLPSAPKEEK